MFDFLKAPFATGPKVEPVDVLVRLVIALCLGGVVSWIYCRTRRNTEIAPSFPTTLVLLSVLIAMVTQVIGDNVARAFSLVGALSIVRFRTIVRDTQDTAYVIFAVVVGMAVGAKNPWVAFIGLGVVAMAAFIMMFLRPSTVPGAEPEYVLSMRVGLGQDLEKLLNGECDAHLAEKRLVSMGTAKQGISLNIIYQVRLRPDASADELVKILNRVEGVQSIQLERRGWEEN
jgi:cell division protein FtsW (lipid II flippase)